MALTSAPSSRPPLARMLRIHEKLKDGFQTNCTKLATELEVSTKTVMRDLAFMRDQLDLPAEYDPRTYTWRYAHPVKSFPTIDVTEGELLALLVAQKALEKYKGTQFYNQLAHAFDKLSSSLKDTVSFSASDNLGTVSFHQLGLGKQDMKLFDKLSRAVLQSREIEFDYRKPGRKTPETRRVQPYHLANRENAWYLVGFDCERQALRHFAVSRIGAVREKKETFLRPTDFSPEKHFGKSFGAYVGEGDYKVVIRFSSAVADRIRERFWHETQDTRDLPDGGVEFSLHLNSLQDIQSWVLSWGADAEVLAPKELVAGVRTAVASLRKLYR